MEVLTPRDVPLGGPRAMRVRRTLPQRHRTTIGAWCFVDHYGPDDVRETGGMVLPPHPHTGLQTVSWLFEGEIEHRDSAGHHAFVRPGAVNLMTAGRGISHSEDSTVGTQVLHGAQLWIVLPDEHRHTAPGFVHHEAPLLEGDRCRARVFLGTLLGHTSPVPTYSPVVGAEVRLDPGGRLEVDVDPAHEHGFLVDAGVLLLDDEDVKPGELAYVAPGATSIVLAAGDEPVRLLVLGGEPFDEPIVMWWNFVGRTHEEVVGYRQEWQDQITRDGTVIDDSREVADGRFGRVDHPQPPIPAPPLPNARLKERR
ncbi:MAG TPA: pirin family protein [Nocardioides sp.]|nr:pirin family protein [Nocardioides sp.]